jgi:CrcB protein
VALVEIHGMSDSLVKILMVMAGGSLGAAARYGVSLAAVRLVGTGFPWGTFLVNMAGCFAIGVLAALADRLPLFSPALRLFFMTGFLGALTTFSTYAFETVAALRSGQWAGAAANFTANNLGGVLLVLAGMAMVQALLRGQT